MYLFCYVPNKGSVYTYLYIAAQLLEDLTLGNWKDFGMLLVDCVKDDYFVGNNYRSS